MKTITVTLFLVAASATAFGQGYPASNPPPPPPGQQSEATITRQGLTVGAGLGVGRLSDDSESLSGAGVWFRIGAAFHPRAVVVADVATNTADNGGVRFFHQFVGVSVLGFVHERVFLGGGVGMQRVSAEIDGDEIGETDSEVGLVATVGVELMQRNDFAVSGEVRAFAAQFGNETITSSALGVAVSWY